MNKRKIGNVSFIVLKDNTREEYSDGEIEERLLRHFKQKNPDNLKFEQENPGWATTYHFSSERQNILNWYDFQPGSTLLEVGAGCGALTELFTDRCEQVTAIELSPRRAEINAHRNRNKKNLEIVVGNLENLPKHSTEKFDYVVCVGVLEYAGRFINSKEPFKDFLGLLKQFVKPKGEIILAIENKLGMKYLSGAREDHVRRLMESIEDYPQYSGIRTFGKQELANLFHENNLLPKFYYPFPDYKLPNTIFSEDYEPGIHTQNLPYGLYPTRALDQEREYVFREQLAIRSFANNKLYGEFANSFLVVASAKGGKSPSQPVFARCSTKRKEPYRIITRIYRDQSGEFHVSKSPCKAQNRDHLSQMAKTENKLKAIKPGFRVCPVARDTEGNIGFKYVDGISLDNVLTENILNKDYDGFAKHLDQFIHNLEKLPSKTLVPSKQEGFAEVLGNYSHKTEACITSGLLDVNFDNFIIDDDGRQWLIDYEWVFDFAIPRRFLVTRALFYFFAQKQQLLVGAINKDNTAIRLSESVIVPEVIYKKYKKYFQDLTTFSKMESAFQTYVIGHANTVRFHKQPELLSEDISAHNIESYLQRIHCLENNNREYSQLIKAQQDSIDNLNGELLDIKRSKAWRLVTKARGVKTLITRR